MTKVMITQFQFQFLVQFLELSQALSSIPIQFRNWPQLCTYKVSMYTLVFLNHPTNVSEWSLKSTHTMYDYSAAKLAVDEPTR